MPVTAIHACGPMIEGARVRSPVAAPWRRLGLSLTQVGSCPHCADRGPSSLMASSFAVNRATVLDYGLASKDPRVDMVEICLNEFEVSAT
jgi:hypothetical protein